MINSFIERKFRENLPYTPNAGQENAIREICNFLTDREPSRLFLLKGYAGTGKTSLTGSLVKTLSELKQPVVLLAPTGRAAKVFSAYANHPAFTIHKKIYRQKSFANEAAGFGIMPNLHKDTLFIIDEASMIHNTTGEGAVFGTGCLLDDLIQYVYSEESCRMMILGDTAQLPPVGQAESPALNADYLKGYGLDVTELILRQVARQSEESGILYNATQLREQLESEYDLDELPQFKTDGFPDLYCVDGNELAEHISDCYNRDGIDETILITRSNKRANIFNQNIRGRVLYREEELSGGDLLMITKNNYFWSKDYEEMNFIANGEMAEIVRKRNEREIYGFRFTDASLRFPDYNIEVDVKILLDTLHSDTPSLPYEQQNRFFNAVLEDYADIPTRGARMKKLKEDPFYNALQVKYAYAVTCHKAQGGQWKNVFIDLGNLNVEHLGADFYRWLYTALTRATERVFLLNMAEEMKEIK
ncbi:MAG: AAA family ATPase [Bacteroidota bacterium]|nr:AAA family ATPase [Bacteroidota bacterium]